MGLGWVDRMVYGVRSTEYGVYKKTMGDVDCGLGSWECFVQDVSHQFQGES